jgi:diguanylate cyclase (GGDEF)-like protein
MKVLMVEDSPLDARIVSAILEYDRPNPIHVEHADSVNSAKQILQEKKYDALLVDLDLPDSRGLDTMLRLQADAPGVPIVVLTGNRDDQMAQQAVRSGAEDYLVKGELSARALRRSLSSAVERHRLKRNLYVVNDRLKRRNARLAKLCDFDPLTRILNRRGFQKALASEQARRRRSKNLLHLVRVDLDDFKGMNESLGHSMGDSVLRRIGHLLKGALSGCGHSARIGGDEFLILLPQLNREEVSDFAERLRAAIAGLHEAESTEKLPAVTASVATVEVPQHRASFRNLLELSQQALAHAKQGGKNRVVSRAFFAD